MANNCSPEITFYMGGASAQAGALNTVLLTDGKVFDSTKGPVIKVTDNTTVTATAPSGGGNTVAYYGFNAAGKRVAVIYNKANGSFAGVYQLIKDVKSAPEGLTLQLTTAKEGATAAGKATPCVVGALTPATTKQMAYTSVSCTGSQALFSTAWGIDKQKIMHLALADVRPSEATPGILGGVIGKWKPSAFPTESTGLQGFGVIVSPGLYTKMIEAQVAKGRLPASCTSSETVGGATDVITAACQPNLSTAAYTSLVTGTAQNLGEFLGTTSTDAMILARRTVTSGTQASSNIFFANQAATAAKAALQTTDNAPTVIPGNPADPTLAVTAAGSSVSVYEKTGTGDVITAVSGAGTAGFAIGVVSLENIYDLDKTKGKLKGALYVKIDGISPNLTVDSAGATVVDPKNRVGLLNGYPFAYEMQALTLADAKLLEPYKTIKNTIVTGLKDTTANLSGIAYIGATDATLAAPYRRVGGGITSNYAPLSK
jgi:hypothetical protein